MSDDDTHYPNPELNNQETNTESQSALNILLTVDQKLVNADDLPSQNEFDSLLESHAQKTDHTPHELAQQYEQFIGLIDPTSAKSTRHDAIIVLLHNYLQNK